MTQLAISLIKNRLQDTYGNRMKFASGSAAHDGRDGHPSGMSLPKDISLVRIIGEPTTPNEAATLAEEDRRTNTNSNGGRWASSARDPSSRRKARTTALTERFYPATTQRQPRNCKCIERPTSAAAIEETSKKAPESKKKHGKQGELDV